MRDFLRQYLPAILLILAGFTILVVAMVSGQNWKFKLAAFGILVAGVIFMVNIMMKLGKMGNVVLGVGLALFAGIFLSLDYRSIKDKVDEDTEWKRRETFIVQRLKDIRAVQSAHKEAYGTFCADFDSLARFIDHGKIMLIKSIGVVPDGMDEQEAIEAGIVLRDTTYESVLQSTHIQQVIADPKRTVPLNLDSLRYIPFADTGTFWMSAGSIERSGVKIPVFEVKDRHPFIKDAAHTRRVGSMNDPSIAGNWE